MALHYLSNHRLMPPSSDLVRCKRFFLRPALTCDLLYGDPNHDKFYVYSFDHGFYANFQVFNNSLSLLAWASIFATHQEEMSVLQEAWPANSQREVSQFLVFRLLIVLKVDPIIIRSRTIMLCLPIGVRTKWVSNIVAMQRAAHISPLVYWGMAPESSGMPSVQDSSVLI